MTTASVGIVLVSHSAELAEGAAKVEDALRQADQGAGVVVLPDLGSAVLTVRAVLEDYGTAGSILLADAPFVEGAVAATVIAAAGGDLKAVAAAAEEARHARKL
jgi:PTS hybrid protein